MGFSHANLISILIAAVAAWIFGGAYYTALGKPWMAAQGKTLEQCKAEQDGKSGFAKGAPFVIVFVFCWFGFVLTTIATNNAFQGRRVMLTVIDSVGWLGAFVIIGAIVGWWGQ